MGYAVPQFLLLQAGKVPGVELVSALGLFPLGVCKLHHCEMAGATRVWALQLVPGEPALPVALQGRGDKPTQVCLGQPAGGDFAGLWRMGGIQTQE